MPKRVRLKLPPFNLTKRSISGKVVHQFIPRGCTHTNGTVIEENVCSSGTGMHHEVGFQDIPPENLPTLHEVYHCLFSYFLQRTSHDFENNRKTTLAQKNQSLLSWVVSQPRPPYAQKKSARCCRDSMGAARSHYSLWKRV